MCSNNNNNILKNNFINSVENEDNKDNNEYFTAENYYNDNYNKINEPRQEPIKIKEHYTQNVNPNPVEQTEKPVQQTSEQVSIKIPIINDEIFNPKNIEFDYGDANNVNYTLGVKDNPMDVKKQADNLTSKDLLPPIPGKEDKKWFENPDVGIRIEEANLLSDAVQKVGVDTVGQTRKNPSYDIRGTVPCPKFQISPWNNSTTEPDYNLKSLY
jgi:hypothetical protein